MNVHYGLDGAKQKITQYGGCESSVLEGVDQIVRRAGRLKTGIDGVPVGLVETLQLDSYNYIMAAFVALMALTITHHGRLGRYIHVNVTIITGNLKAPIETVERLRSPYSSGD